ncbi:acetate--CoA ligase family protein [Amycolatopsis pigmentata]|uniref:Acetate--CoA ligase family protein n=1 Tax=Amycolatopsis pigmentata TaxID=450801 RepID=A0ABW5G948_9PSEU
MPEGTLARAVLQPRSVALVGVSADVGKVSSLAVRNLRKAGYRGEIHLVHPRGGTIGGVAAYESIAQLPRDIDLAMSAVGADRAVEVVRGLGERGVKAVVVVSSGYSEAGVTGEVLERQLLEAAREHGTRLIGPNCNGLYSGPSGLSLGINRSHGEAHRPGGISIVSQSGALIGTVTDLCARGGGGLRAFVSTGNEVDLTLTDLLEFLVPDEETSVIALILDRVGDGQRFRELCRRARAAGKHVLAFKFGNSAPGREASRSHSARLAGDSSVYDVLFEQAGVRRCATLAELAATAALLDARGAPRSSGVLVASMSGAGGALMVDALDERGVPLAEIEPAVVKSLEKSLRFVRPGNPVDVGAGGSANSRRNFEILRPIARGRVSVMLYTPPPTKEYAALYAEAVADFATHGERDGSCVIAVVMDHSDPEVIATWSAAGIAVVHSPIDAAAVAANLLDAGGVRAGPQERAAEWHDDSVMDEIETTELLADSKISFAPYELVSEVSHARAAADRIGYPVVVKGILPGLAHKARHGLVALNLESPDAVEEETARMMRSMREMVPGNGDSCRVSVARQVRDGVDLLVSIRRDQEFGWVAVVGVGGTFVERIASVRILLPPVGDEQVREALVVTGAAAQLDSIGMTVGEAVDVVGAVIEQLAEVLHGAGRHLETIELNPLRLGPAGSGAVALDALGIVGPNLGK